MRLEWTILMALCFPCHGWQAHVSMDEGGTSYHHCLRPWAVGTGQPNTVSFLLFFITHFCLFGRLIGFVPTGSPWVPQSWTSLCGTCRISHSHTERGISLPKAKSPEVFLIMFCLPTCWELKVAVVLRKDQPQLGAWISNYLKEDDEIICEGRVKPYSEMKSEKVYLILYVIVC